MTENEAIKDIQFLARRYDDLQEVNMSVSQESLDMAIQALEEIQQYRAIGTVEGYKRAVKVSKENYYLCAEYKARLKEYEAIGTIDEFKALKEKSVAKIGLSRGQGHESYLVCPTCNSHMKDDQELFDLDGEIIQCKKCKQLVIVDWQ